LAAESCKRTLEITVPAEEVERETARVVQSLREQVRLPGFRPGKVPDSIIRARFPAEVRKGVLDALVPRYLRAEVERQNLDLVGVPQITDIQFEPGQPLRFRAEIEVSPQFELADYRDLTVHYEEPQVTEEEVRERLERLRERRAEFVSEEPRPIREGDYAVLALESIAGLPGKPIREEELTVLVGGPDTLPDFTENLLGMEPGQEKEFDVRYPEDYAQERLAGRTVRFRVRVKGIRRKELPALDDEFARELGDYQDLEDLKRAIRATIRAEKEFLAQHKAKDEIIDQLVRMHDFPVPEAYVERQIEINVEQRVRELIAQGIDPRRVQIDWDRVKEKQREPAIRDVKAALILDKIAEREAIEVTRDELEAEIERIAREEREPVATVRARLEERGELGRIAARLRAQKTLNFLFEQARKIAPGEEA